jgi:hypothetical protein
LPRELEVLNAARPVHLSERMSNDRQDAVADTQVKPSVRRVYGPPPMTVLPAMIR